MISAKRCIKTLRLRYAKALRPSNPTLTIVNHINLDDNDDWMRPFYASFNKTITEEERTMSKLQLEVGKKYDTRDGRIVEIVLHNKNCSSPAEEFVGLVQSGSQPDKTMPRTYYADGRSSGSVRRGVSGRDLIHEHVEKPPFKLKVGEVYPTRDGNGFGFVRSIGPLFTSVLLFNGGRLLDRAYGHDGRVRTSIEQPEDLVPGPFRDQQTHRQAMAVREAMNLAFDIASGKRAVAHFRTNYGGFNNLPRVMRHEWHGADFALIVHHGGVHS